MLGATPPSGWKVIVPSLPASSVLENDRFFYGQNRPCGVSSHLLLAKFIGGCVSNSPLVLGVPKKLTDLLLKIGRFTTQKEFRRMSSKPSIFQADSNSGALFLKRLTLNPPRRAGSKSEIHLPTIDVRT